jgi:hypothetical protein
MPLAGLFHERGQFDVFSGERPLAGAAEHEQCFGEVDCAGVDGLKAVEEFDVAAIRIHASRLASCR